MYSDYVFTWLENCLDYGLAEADFWNMTLAEIDRALNSKRRQLENEQRIRATYDYILADLIGRSIGRLYSSSNKMPELADAYPSLFDSEEIQEQKQANKQELSVIRFKQFAETYNKKFIGGGKVTDERTISN